jgi:AmmeMemoRadiSam system protein A
MELTERDKRILLEAARCSIQDGLSLGGRETREVSGVLATPCGAFVTLKKEGELRGCIGRMDESQALLRVVEAMAKAAAFEDTRFQPLRVSEFDRIRIEISVLTPMRRIKDSSEIEVGKHGVHMRSGFRSGVFLPQVPVEWGWDLKTYLNQLCRKAGLPESSLADPGTELSVFEAIVFGEEDGPPAS